MFLKFDVNLKKCSFFMSLFSKLNRLSKWLFPSKEKSSTSPSKISLMVSRLLQRIPKVPSWTLGKEFFRKWSMQNSQLINCIKTKHTLLLVYWCWIIQWFFLWISLIFFFLEYIRPLWHCWKQRTKHRRLASSWEVIIMNINLICLSVYNEIKSSFECYHLNLGNVLHVHNEYKTLH